MQDYRKLNIWKEGRLLVKQVYLITDSFPRKEVFGITSQLRRATTSIVLNIAEGSGRDTVADFKHFLDMALGSVNEAETLITLCNDLDFIDKKIHDEVNDKLDHIRRMILNFKKSM